MKQQTAVEWYAIEMAEYLRGIYGDGIINLDILKQAKEIEKEKMNRVWNDSRTNLVRSSNGFDFYTSFEDYYNETYGGNK
jgi:hypothetical protein